jgi:hypothetical protein
MSPIRKTVVQVIHDLQCYDESFERCVQQEAINRMKLCNDSFLKKVVREEIKRQKLMQQRNG